MFSQVSVRLRGGGGGYPSPRFFPRSLVLSHFTGIGYPSPGRGVLQSQAAELPEVGCRDEISHFVLYEGREAGQGVTLSSLGEGEMG